MEVLQHAVNWVEIPATDFNRAKKFYGNIFDYDMPEMMMGPNRMGFLLFNQKGGGIGAAIVQGQGYVPTVNGARVYLNGGSDLKIILDRVAKAGGKIVMDKMLVSPELGHFGAFEDTEGNLIHLHSLS